MEVKKLAEAEVASLEPGEKGVATAALGTGIDVPGITHVTSPTSRRRTASSTMHGRLVVQEEPESVLRP
jgi:hypothetical protein